VFNVNGERILVPHLHFGIKKFSQSATSGYRHMSELFFLPARETCSGARFAMLSRKVRCLGVWQIRFLLLLSRSVRLLLFREKDHGLFVNRAAVGRRKGPSERSHRCT
jgi:hypothetical protein